MIEVHKIEFWRVTQVRIMYYLPMSTFALSSPVPFTGHSFFVVILKLMIPFRVPVTAWINDIDKTIQFNTVSKLFWMWNLTKTNIVRFGSQTDSEIKWTSLLAFLYILNLKKDYSQIISDPAYFHIRICWIQSIYIKNARLTWH